MLNPNIKGLLRDLGYLYAEKNKQHKVLEAAYSYALVVAKYKNDPVMVNAAEDYLKLCCLELTSNIKS